MSKAKKPTKAKEISLTLTPEDWTHLRDVALAHIDFWVGNLNNKLWHMDDVEASCEEIIAGYRLYLRAKEALGE